MIFALAITGVSLIAIFAIRMLILISMAIADNGYVGKHRELPDERKKKASKRTRAPSAPRSYHRTLGARDSRPIDRRPVSRDPAAARRRERGPARQSPTSA